MNFKNTRIYSHLKIYYSKLLNHTKKKNRILSKCINKLSRIDSIDDVNTFKQVIIELKERNLGFLSVGGLYGESYYYGYYKELLHYSKTHPFVVPLVGYMEHGIVFTGGTLGVNSNAVSFTRQGSYRNEEIRKSEKYLPIYTIGPFINYSRHYYSKKKRDAIKKKYGKILLVFPSHSCEGEESRNSMESYIDIIFEKYAVNYDSVWVCVYWYDICERDIELFEKRGAKIVSAGFRADCNFIRRLKTIISLSDCIIVNDIGTNIGFSLALNKKCIMINDNRSLYVSNDHRKAYNIFMKAFCTDNGSFTDSQLLQQNKLFDYYWNGDVLRTKKYIKSMFSLTKKIMKLSNYNFNNRDEIVKKMINKEIHLSDDHYKILIESLR